MKKRRRYKWIVVVALIVALVSVVQITRHFFMEEEREARIRLRHALLDEYPEAVSALKAQYGLKPFTLSRERMAGRASKETVVLVHGIDEPGKAWMNLAPDLVAAGYAVWLLTYPNDQPIAESARFFLSQLEASRLAPTKRIAVVTHSMGGLVTREMLTDPALAYGAKVQEGLLPQVDTFIMVGTPNHGSELARFRGFLEIRDQLGSLFKGDYHWLKGVVDGTGEAGIDLIPDSAFMQRLNSRPHPTGVRMLVIAGVMNPKQKQEIEALARRWDTQMPEAARGIADLVAEGLIAMTEKVGDGAVSVDSARLTGVPLVTVPGTHLSIIRNLTIGSQRIPPAIPVIMKMLEGWTPGGEISRHFRIFDSGCCAFHASHWVSADSTIGSQRLK